MNPVLDASVYVASISPGERHHASARELLGSHAVAEPYLVPALFRVEVIAALSRRGEASSRLEAVDARIRGPRFQTCAVDEALIALSVEVAGQARLRAYDAVYVALALLRRTDLWTLDAEIGMRLEGLYPDLRVIGCP